MGFGLSGALCRVLARARQRVLGRHLGGDRVSAASWRLAAQGLVPHDRHRGRRRGDRRADRMLPAGPRRRFSSAWRCGAPAALSSPRCCAISRPMRRRWPATRRRSSRATSSARPAARTAQAFMLAVTRASEICIGIVCAGIVLAGTDLGGARRRLATLFAAISAEITGRFTGMLALAGPDLPETQPVRREFVRRVIALDPVIDEAIGESSQLRYHSPVLQRAVDGLFAALAGWRTVAVQLAGLPRRRGPARGGRRPASSCRRSCDRRPSKASRRAGWPTRRPAPDLRGGGAEADRAAGRHAIAAAACRPDG